MPDGVLYVPCGDRRACVCPPCAETYRADTYQLIRAGLAGGKGVPTSVAGHPAVFATLTAPSFGPVHTRTGQPQDREGRARAGCAATSPSARTAGGSICTARHTEDHPSLGPAALPGLLRPRRTTSSGTPGPANSGAAPPSPSAARCKPLERAHGIKLRVSYGKVAEYQRRGVVHFHALIRLDRVDPADPDADTPATGRDHRRTTWASSSPPPSPPPRFRTPDYPDTTHSWPIEWGRQLDVRPLRTGSVIADGAPDVSTEAVAAYLAKYATKATEPTGLPVTGRMNGETAEHYSDPDTHLGRLIAYAWQLGTLPSSQTSEQQRQDWHDTYGRLRRWTHMLGFGGHFATKSRRYSTTHKQLRAARREYQRTTRADWREPPPRTGTTRGRPPTTTPP